MTSLADHGDTDTQVPHTAHIISTHTKHIHTAHRKSTYTFTKHPHREHQWDRKVTLMGRGVYVGDAAKGTHWRPGSHHPSQEGSRTTAIPR
jgi:hypothetical protein